jgi:hypothetical protein
MKVLQCNYKSWFAPISWLIKKVQGTNYSHYAIEFDNYIMDAGSKGVCLHSKADFFKRYDVYKTFEFKPKKCEGIFVKYFLHKPYGFLSLFGIFFKSIGVTHTNPFSDKNETLICSELIVVALHYFFDVEIKKQDDYDLIKTEKLIKATLYANNNF